MCIFSVKILYFVSDLMIPCMIFYIVGNALAKKKNVYEDFLSGAGEGLRTVVKILPTLIGLMVSVGVLRASGFLDFLGEALTAPAAFLHIPPPLVPLLIVRLISNSAATGLLLDLFREFGTDSFTGISASILMSCTETVFYCLSVYFGSVNVTRTRYTLAGAMTATAAGAAAAIFLASL